jgi:hypothetical protein
MATIPIRFGVGGQGHRLSYTPVEAITGGQVVEARALAANPGQRACGVAASGSVLVAGVAVHDIRAVAASIQDDAVVGHEHALAVVSFAIVPVTFQAAATRGQSLIVGTTAGQVAPAAATPDGRTLIGYCVSDSVAGGAVGLAFIRPSGG